MPNYVTNCITLKGDQGRIKELRDAIMNDEKRIGSMDFNKIIPMPESLNIVCGSDSDRGLKWYKDFISVYLFGRDPEKVDTLNIPPEREEVFLKMRIDIDRDTFDLGRAAYQNILKYGAPTWYEWSIQNWGTKWNAIMPDTGYDSYDETIIAMDTAWSAPHPVVAKLAQMYPDIEFTHEWADEDIGNNCGRYVYRDGIRVDEYFPETNKEAVEFAAYVMDSDPSDWGLKLNEEGTEYEYSPGNVSEDIGEMQL